MSKHEPVAISLRPPSGVAPEFGPLVRAQPIGRRWDAPLSWAMSIGAALWAATIGVGVLSYAGLMSLMLAVAASPAVMAASAAGWRRWRLRRCARWDGSGQPPGGAVRVTGVVRGLGEPFTPPGETRQLIYARTRFQHATPDGRPDGGQSREDVRGLFLEIELSPDVSVRIAPEVVRLIGGEMAMPELGPELRWRLGAPWSGWWRGKLRRSILCPGDRVEAVGAVVREVSTQGVASPGRGVPMIQWLTPAWPGGVWIRKLEDG
jgi:hypothetical protein